MTSRDRTWSSWFHMLDRCTNPKSDSFVNYGGRGITVCDRWLDFDAFLSDMGSRPAGTSLGRINNDGPYCASNCRWESPKEQARNTRRNVLIDGRVQAEVAAGLGLSDSTVSRRRRAGRDITAPANFSHTKLDRRKVAEIKARFSSTDTNVAIARDYGVSHSLIASIRRGECWVDV